MTEKPSLISPPKLLDQVRGKIRLKHYSIRTEQSYVDWIKRFIFFHGKRHPKASLHYPHLACNLRLTFFVGHIC